MKISKLYDILGLKPFVPPPAPKMTVIVSNDSQTLFKAAAQSIVQSHCNTHSFNSANQTITEYKNDIIQSNIRFVNSSSPEILRGQMIDTLIIDEDIRESDLRYIKSCLGPVAKEIIMLDKQE